MQNGSGQDGREGEERKDKSKSQNDSDSERLRSRQYDASSDDESDYGSGAGSYGVRKDASTAKLNARKTVGISQRSGEKSTGPLLGFSKDVLQSFDADAYDRIASGEAYMFGLSRNSFFLLVALAAFVVFAVMVGTFYGYHGEAASPVPALEGIARQPKQLLQTELPSILGTDVQGRRDPNAQSSSQSKSSDTAQRSSTESNSGSHMPPLPPTAMVPTIASSEPITPDQVASAQVAAAASSIKETMIYPESLSHTEIARREAIRKRKEQERRQEIAKLVAIRDSLRDENTHIRKSIRSLQRAINLRNPQPAVVLDAPLPADALQGKAPTDAGKLAKGTGGAKSAAISATGTSNTEVVLQQLADPSRHPEGRVIVSKPSGANAHDEDDDEVPGAFRKETQNQNLRPVMIFQGKIPPAKRAADKQPKKF